MKPTAYDIDEKGNENRILFWLRLDVWEMHEAALLMIDIDPDSVSWATRDEKDCFNSIKTFNGLSYLASDDFDVDFEDFDENLPITKQLDRYTQSFEDMTRILSSKRGMSIKPIEWIELAISKKISIPWLDFAIDMGFYANPCANGSFIAKRELNNLFDKTNPNYPPELDIAIQAWHAVVNSPGKGKPKARIRAWLNLNTTLANEAKERISIVCNWDKLGGATRSD